MRNFGIFLGLTFWYNSIAKGQGYKTHNANQKETTMQTFRIHVSEYNYDLSGLLETLSRKAKRTTWGVKFRLNSELKTIDFNCSFATLERIEVFLDAVVTPAYQVETVD
jgi:hypothetical protein